MRFFAHVFHVGWDALAVYSARAVVPSRKLYRRRYRCSSRRPCWRTYALPNSATAPTPSRSHIGDYRVFFSFLFFRLRNFFLFLVIRYSYARVTGRPNTHGVITMLLDTSDENPTYLYIQLRVQLLYSDRCVDYGPPCVEFAYPPTTRKTPEVDLERKPVYSTFH